MTIKVETMKVKVLLCLLVFLSSVLSEENTVNDFVTAKSISWYNGGEICLSLLEQVRMTPYHAYIYRTVYYNGTDLSLTLRDDKGYIFKVDLLNHDCHKFSVPNNLLCGQFSPRRTRYKKLQPVQLNGYISVFSRLGDTLVSQGNVDKNITRVALTGPKDEQFETKNLCRYCEAICQRTCLSVQRAGRHVICKATQQQDTTVEQQTNEYTSHSYEGTTVSDESSQSKGNQPNGEVTTVHTFLSTEQTSSSQPKVFSDGEMTSLHNESSTEQSSRRQTNVTSYEEAILVPNESSTGQNSNKTSSPNYGFEELNEIQTSPPIEIVYETSSKDQENPKHFYYTTNHKLVMNDYFSLLKNHGKVTIASTFVLLHCLCLSIFVSK